MKTIAQQLGITEFPFEIRDKNGNVIYWEKSNNSWYIQEYDSNGTIIYLEEDGNVIFDDRPKLEQEVTLADISEKFNIPLDKLRIKD